MTAVDGKAHPETINVVTLVDDNKAQLPDGIHPHHQAHSSSMHCEQDCAKDGQSTHQKVLGMGAWEQQCIQCPSL